MTTVEMCNTDLHSKKDLLSGKEWDWLTAYRYRAFRLWHAPPECPHQYHLSWEHQQLVISAHVRLL
jgi:hypothetical protein